MPEDTEKEEIKEEEIEKKALSESHKKRQCCPLTGNPIYWAQITFGLILGLVIGLSMPMVLGPTILGTLTPIFDASLSGAKVSGMPHDLSETTSWHEGAKGYEEALLLQKESGKPIFLYFYAPWCSYCGKFNAGLVNQAKVQNYLEQHFINVRVYPDTKEADFLLFRQYNVSSYPTVFVKTAMADDEASGEKELKGVMKVDAFKVLSGAWVMKSQEEFIDYLTDLTASKDETALSH